MTKQQLKELLNICSLHNLNPKKLKEFNKAIKIYKDCGADGWAEKAEKELATIL